LSDSDGAAAHWAAAFLFLAAVHIGSSVNPALADEAPPGAASCTGCHPMRASLDTPVPRLAGQDAGAIIAAMQDFRSGKRPATVMDRIAKGFPDDEIRAVAAWFMTQP
jgi:cytochrome subunit of sulfide dehydrogenase